LPFSTAPTKVLSLFVWKVVKEPAILIMRATRPKEEKDKGEKRKGNDEQDKSNKKNGSAADEAETQSLSQALAQD